MSKATRKIAAILAADVVDYSRLMGVDDEKTLAVLKERRAIFDRLVSEFQGQEFGSVGDSLMAQFPSAVNAVRCAQAIQRAIAEANDSTPGDRRMSLRIGVNLGDVIEEDGALFGDGVNVAARLQSLAEPGGILVSGSVNEQVKNKLDARITFAGARQVKNIAEPVKTYEVSEPALQHLGHRVVAFLWQRGMIAAATYVVASWLLVWGYGRLAGSVNAPSWLLPAMITLLAAGFIPAVAIAWRRVGRRPAAPWIQLLAVSLATVRGATVVWSAWRDYARRRRTQCDHETGSEIPAGGRGRRAPESHWRSEARLAERRPGQSSARWARRIESCRGRLSEALAGRPCATTRTRTDASGDVLASAGRAGIDYVVSGEFLPGPEGLLLTARLTDVDRDIEHGATPVREDLTQQTLLGEASRLVLMAKRGLKVPHTETVGSFSADFAVNNMAAYEAYVGGIGYLLKFDYASADRAFRKALELAPEFHMARYRLAQVQVVSGDTEAALATLDRIPQDAPLNRRERFYVDGAMPCSRATPCVPTIYNAVLEEFPFDAEARMLLVLAHDLAFEDDAAVAELKRLVDQEPQNDYVWSYLGETYLRLGEYDLARHRSIVTCSSSLAIRSDLRFSGSSTSSPAIRLPRPRHFTHALELEPGFVPARLALAQTQVLQGEWLDAERLLRALVADRDVPVINRIDAAFDLSSLLRAEGRFTASLEPLRELEPQIRKEPIREAMALAERGIAQAELGRFDEAGELIDLAVERSPGASTRYLFARGSILSMRGNVPGVRAAAEAIRSQRLASSGLGRRQRERDEGSGIS